MLVTRPEPDASDTAARLQALAIEPVIAPLLTQQALRTSLPDRKGFAAIAVTSSNAIRALEERGALAAYLDLPLYAVGDKTASLARAKGFAKVVSAGGSLADLAELLAHLKLKGPVFYPAGREQSGDLAKSLAPYGVMVITALIYTMTRVQSLSEAIIGTLEAGGIAAALFYSRRTATAFVELCGNRLSRASKARLGMLCLSEGIAEPLIGAHFVRVGLADYPSEEAMMGLALSFARDQNRA